METHFSAAVAQIVDVRNIRAVYTTYCDIIDHRRFSDLSEVYTPDCRRHYVDVHGHRVVKDADARGVEAQGLEPLVRRLAATRWFRTHHNVSNFRIEVHGDRASARVHYYAVHQAEPGAPILSLWGEYDDDLIRTNSGWRIDERRYSTWLSEGDWANRPGWRDGEPIAPTYL